MTAEEIFLFSLEFSVFCVIQILSFVLTIFFKRILDRGSVYILLNFLKQSKTLQNNTNFEFKKIYRNNIKTKQIVYSRHANNF